MEDNPEAHAILETLASRFNELEGDAPAGETYTIKVNGVTIESLMVRGSMLWFYGKDNAVIFAQHYTISTTRHFSSAARTIHQFARAGSAKVSKITVIKRNL